MEIGLLYSEFGREREGGGFRDIGFDNGI